MTNHLFFRVVSTFAIAIALAIVSLSVRAENPHGRSPFTNIYSFGDSLSDTGNASDDFSDLGVTFPEPPYVEGRMSNGTLWNEYLAADLDLELDLDNNYSYIGAETGIDNYNPFPPHMQIGFADQVDQFLDDVSEEGIHPRDLFLVMIGANDFFAFFDDLGPFPIPSGVDRTLEGIESLLSAGARHLVVLNVPDLGNTPAFSALFSDLSDDDRAVISLLCSQYNALLELGLQGLKSSYSFNLVTVDAYDVINQIIADPGLFGLSNVSIPAILGADQNASLFWDWVHPTTAGHRILADFAIDAMIDSYSPPLGVPFADDPWFAPASVVRGNRK